MAKDFDPHRLDVPRFAGEGGTLSAQSPLAGFARLLAEAQGEGADRMVHWQAQGELRHPRHVHPEVWLHVQAEALLPLVCQRCLQPVDVAVSVERDFRFAPDEATAAAEDDASEEDVLALSRQFDLPGLVEDELLMELPVAPRHDTCPQPVKMSAVDPDFEQAEAARAHPFAVLDRLKTPKH